MKTYLLQAFLLMSGMTTAYGQVNLSDMAVDSSDSLQKSKDFSQRRVRGNSIRDYPKVLLWDSFLCLYHIAI